MSKMKNKTERITMLTLFAVVLFVVSSFVIILPPDINPGDDLLEINRMKNELLWKEYSKSTNTAAIYDKLMKAYNKQSL